jgi:SAM-dependent methyltransferase
MSIDYAHDRNPHTVAGACAALPHIFPNWRPKSMLDVGCGLGTWLKAALDFGVSDVFGVDGIDIPEEQFLVSTSQRGIQDLTKPWNLGRRFEVALCMEVAEHLPKSHASTLIDALVLHSDYIVFSAACPGQGGQHHVNCQWPQYWQSFFNERGYACSDDIRWLIWNDPRIEPWYRQNIFIARKDLKTAGLEPRIFPVIHPEGGFVATIADIERGCMRWDWYLSLPFSAMLQKARRRVKQTLRLSR